jgi:hypothetical protein
VPLDLRAQPASVSSKRVLAGADCMKKLRSATAACGTGRPSTSASIIARNAVRSRRKARMSGRSPLGTRVPSISEVWLRPLEAYQMTVG